MRRLYGGGTRTGRRRRSYDPLMEYRRLGRLGHASSVLIYGAASLSEVTQDVADASIEAALAAGINHVDTAASYGDSELRLGATLPSWRDRVFLASKVEERDYAAAWASINRSLERLRTDRLDLLQLHNVSTWETMERVTAADGALRAAVRARDEGLTTGLGITGHTHEAPRIHLEGLRRFDFDTVLTPLNHRLWRVPGFADAFGALAAQVAAGDRGLMTIKAIARRPWPVGEPRYATWYEPFDDQDSITAAVSWVLDGHPEVTGIATAGETRLLDRMLRAESGRVGAAYAATFLDGLPEEAYSSVFVDA